MSVLKLSTRVLMEDEDYTPTGLSEEIPIHLDLNEITFLHPDVDENGKPVYDRAVCFVRGYGRMTLICDYSKLAAEWKRMKRFPAYLTTHQN